MPYESYKQKPLTQEANAIVGVHFDFDEVSGKGKSMFMVTAYGIAVIIEPLVKDVKKTERYEVYERKGGTLDIH